MALTPSKVRGSSGQVNAGRLQVRSASGQFSSAGGRLRGTMADQRQPVALSSGTGHRAAITGRAERTAGGEGGERLTGDAGAPVQPPRPAEPSRAEQSRRRASQVQSFRFLRWERRKAESRNTAESEVQVERSEIWGAEWINILDLVQDRGRIELNGPVGVIMSIMSNHEYPRC